jgi:predicted nucleic acid-binding protein
VRLSVTKKDCVDGYKLAAGDDIEDGVQIAVALNNNIQTFVTGDKKLIQKYEKNKNVDLTWVQIN